MGLLLLLCVSACTVEAVSDEDARTGKADDIEGAQSWTLELPPGESQVIEVAPRLAYGVLTLDAGASTMTVRPTGSDAIYQPLPGSTLQRVAFGIEPEQLDTGAPSLSVEVVNTTEATVVGDLVLSDFDPGQCGSVDNGEAIIGQILLVCDEVTKQRPQTTYTADNFRRGCLFNDDAVRFHLDADLYESVDGYLQTEAAADGWDFELYHDGNWNPVPNPNPKTESGDENWIDFGKDGIYFHTEGLEQSPSDSFFLQPTRSTLYYDRTSQTLNLFTQRDLFPATTRTNWDMDLSCQPAF
jgi:hypothetical protein